MKGSWLNMGRRSMSSRAILGRVKRLENVFAVRLEDYWIDVQMWNGSQGAIFGHTHCCVSCSGRETVWRPCSDEEEIAIMREYYEEMGRRVPCSNERVSFGEFLEYYEYLGPEELVVQRKEIIRQVKDER